jgi:hypothetical protein
MSTQVVVTLSDELLQKATQWASLTRRDLPQTLADALQIAFAPIRPGTGGEVQIHDLSDQQVLALTTIQMKSAHSIRLNELLAKQQDEQLDNEEQSELMALMEVYNRSWIRQSEALAEAVRRGLRQPIIAT